MDASISSSLGAMGMGSLLGKLDMLLGEASEDDPVDSFHRLRLRLGFKGGVVLVNLRKDLEEISTYLEDLSEVEDPLLTANCWMKEVRELSYDIEDYIDSFVRPARNSNITTRSRFSSMSKISHVLAHLPKKKLTYKRASNKISDFIIRAHHAKERYKRYEFDWHNLRRRYVPVGPMPKPYQEGTDLVIDGQMSDLIGTLASDGDHHLKVVSIVGSGGIGKTTLVRVMYRKIRGQFQLRAFIQMTRKPDVKVVLHQMLTQIQKQQYHDHCEDLDLISKVRKHLQNKRYLIIVDDLWSASEWSIISHAFPEGTQRSRIIVTTQIEDVALTCCSYHSGFVHEMRPQDSYSSIKLFFTKCFGSESDCPDTFKEVSNKIIEICGGLPLATVTMASLLWSYPVVLIEEWTYISDSLSSNLRTCPTTEVVRQVLNLSYNNLTHYLKTCLLYLNMYPEGYTICKDDLVKQWVAEGFIDATEGRDMEKVARSYFDELINRRFLQPACIKYNNAIVSCTVHDAVHDLIAYKSVEENFVMVVDSYWKNVELRDKVHRLSLQFGDTKHAKKPADIRTSQVRSLFVFGLFMCMPSITDFKLLRVLNLQLSGHHGGDMFDLTGISELFHLRYLKVSSDVCIELPKHMQDLQYLETLDINAELTAVPWDIIHLPCLLHLHLPFETNLMDWIGSMRSESVQKLGKLTNLRDLRLTCSTTPPLDHLEKNMEALGSLLTGLGNLNSLTVACVSFHTNAVVRSPSNITISWDGFASPLLQRFEWSTSFCAFSKVPKWTREFENLCVLKIKVKELLRDGVDILKGLPALTTLSIYVLAAPVTMTIFGKEGFSVLKYFKYRCSTPWLKFEEGAMPNLWKLKLGFNGHRVDQHDSTHISISHLPVLQEISVKMGGTGADAESDLAAAIINHPSNPQISMQLVDWIFDGDKVTENKVHGRIEKHALMEETGDEVSTDDMGKQTEGEAQGIIDNDVTMKGTEYLVSRKGEDENKQTGERRCRRIEQDDIMKKMEDEKKQAIISNFTPSAPSPHLPVRPIVPHLDQSKVGSKSISSSNPSTVKSGSTQSTWTVASYKDSRDLPRTEGEILSSPNLKAFSFGDLKTASKNFRSDSLLGEGRFGYVFKGWIDEQTLAPSKPGSGMVVAIKKLKPEGFQGHKEWLTEVDYLGQLHHQNLVKLIGYCLDGDNRLLVYEYMPKGSLENHLFRRGADPLSWGIRLKVAIGAAKGLCFLHDAENQVIYRDFKASNILLDSEFNAKLSDFGFATQVMGTRGYAAPEYVATGRLSAKTDVYSFGVMLLELLTGRQVLDKSKPVSEQNLVDWARPYLGVKRRVYRIMDLKLGGQYPKKGTHAVAGIALQCIRNEGKMRPAMSEVVEKLEQLQDPNSKVQYRTTTGQHTADFAVLRVSPQVAHEGAAFSEAPVRFGLPVASSSSSSSSSRLPAAGD